MNYAQELQNYRQKPAVKNLVTEIIRFQIPGQFILGKIIEVKPFQTGKMDKECNQYTMDTVTGTKRFLLGNRLDNELEGIDLVGRILCVQFNGKVDLDGGRTLNLFNIDDLTDVDISKIEKAIEDGEKGNESKTNPDKEISIDIVKH